MRIITPTKDNVLVKRKTKEYRGAIELPDTHTAAYGNQYDVLAVGPKVEHIRVGNTILFGDDQKHKTASFDGQQLFVIKELEVEAIL